MDELRRRGNEERVGLELQLTSVSNVKATRTLLPNCSNGIEKLRAVKPGLFRYLPLPP